MSVIDCRQKQPKSVVALQARQRGVGSAAGRSSGSRIKVSCRQSSDGRIRISCRQKQQLSIRDSCRQEQQDIGKLRV